MRLQLCQGPSATWTGTQKPSAGKNRPTSVGMTAKAAAHRARGIARIVRRIAEDARGQSRRMRAGSVRVARQAGRKQAANAATVMTTNAEPKASGSRGLTLYKRL